MRELFLLDTGPLLEFLILRFQAVRGGKWPDTRIQWHSLWTQLDREDFPKFLAANRGYLATSAGVVTEMYGFLQRAEKGISSQSREGFRQQFWQLLCTTFRDLSLAEHSVPVTAMAEEVLADYGPADAGLLALAVQFVKEVGRVVVLTGDGKLRELCLRHQIQAEFVPDRLETFRKA